MAKVTFTGVSLEILRFGSGDWAIRPGVGRVGDHGFPRNSGYLIPSALVSGGGVAYLREFRLIASSISPSDVQTSTNDSIGGGGAGPSLTTAWRTSTKAITVRRGGASWTFGPIPDSSEPYRFWNPRGLGAFIRGIGAGTYNDFEITLDDNKIDLALPSIGLIKGKRGVAGSRILPIADHSNDVTVTYSLEGIPSEVSFNPGTREISWTKNIAISTFAIRYIATGSDRSKSEVILLLQIDTDDTDDTALSIGDVPSITGYVDELLFEEITEPAEGTPPYNIDIIPELPDELNPNYINRFISGIPSEVYAKTEHTLRVSDASGKSGSSGFNVEILAARVVGDVVEDLNPNYAAVSPTDAMDRSGIGDEAVILRLEVGEAGNTLFKAAYAGSDGVAGTLEAISMTIDAFSNGVDQLHQRALSGTVTLNNRWSHHDDLIDATEDLSDTPVRLYGNDILLCTGRLTAEPQTDFHTVILNVALEPPNEPFPVNIYRGVRCLVEQGTTTIPRAGWPALSNEYTIALMFRRTSTVNTLADLIDGLPARRLGNTVAMGEVHRLVYAQDAKNSYFMVDGELIEGGNQTGNFPAGRVVLRRSRADFAVFNRFIDQAEASAVLQNRIPAHVPGLVGLWHMEDYDGNTSADEKGNNDATHAAGHKWVASGQGDSSLASVPMPLNLFGRQLPLDLVDYLHSLYRFSDELANPTQVEALGPVSRARGGSLSNPKAIGSKSGLALNRTTDGTEATVLAEPATIHSHDGGVRLADLLKTISDRADNIDMDEPLLERLRLQLPCFAGTSRHQQIPSTDELLMELIDPSGWNWHFHPTGAIRPFPLLPPVASVDGTRTLETSGIEITHRPASTGSGRAWSMDLDIYLHCMPSGGVKNTERIKLLECPAGILYWYPNPTGANNALFDPVLGNNVGLFIPAGRWHTVNLSGNIAARYTANLKVGGALAAYRNVQWKRGRANIDVLASLGSILGKDARWSPVQTLDLSTAPGQSEVRHLRRIRRRDLNLRYAFNRAPLNLVDLASGLSAERRNDMITPYREIRSKTQGLNSSPIEVNSPISRDADADAVADLINRRSGVDRWAATVTTGSRSIGLRAGDEVLFTPHSDRLQDLFPRAMRVLSVRIVDLIPHRGPRVEVKLWG